MSRKNKKFNIYIHEPENSQSIKESLSDFYIDQICTCLKKSDLDNIHKNDVIDKLIVLYATS